MEAEPAFAFPVIQGAMLLGLSPGAPAAALAVALSYPPLTFGALSFLFG